MKKDDTMKYARGGMTSLDYLMEIQRLENELKKYDWVSVKDRLPEDGQEVFAYCSEADSFEMLVLRCLSENMWINRALDIYENVTHWMPLPLPPKENEDV